jgi:mRNA-degrading endonuclease RelE of RelBE toxin-antitoxin system
MEIKFSKNSIKFLNKLTSKNREQIREKILLAIALRKN